MRSTNVMRALTTAVGVFLLSACSVYVRPHPGVLYIPGRPPSPIVEVVSVGPGPDYVWVPGRYGWTSGAYVWIGGRYERPPRGFRRYQPGVWRHDRHGWYWIEGRWR